MMKYFIYYVYDKMIFLSNIKHISSTPVFKQIISEWIDFPRGDQHLPDGRVIPGNGNSFDKCRRRFDLVILYPNLI